MLMSDRFWDWGCPWNWSCNSFEKRYADVPQALTKALKERDGNLFGDDVLNWGETHAAYINNVKGLTDIDYDKEEDVEKAYRAGDPVAAFIHAKRLWDNDLEWSGPKNPLVIFECLAGMDYPFAYYYVGKAWSDGCYMVADTSKESAMNSSDALCYWRKGAALGDPACYYAMGTMAVAGYEWIIGPDEGIEYFKKAIELGDKRGYGGIAGIMLWNPENYPLDDIVYYSLMAIKEGDTEILDKLIKIYEERRG